jgi:hypothetical protein
MHVCGSEDDYQCQHYASDNRADDRIQWIHVCSPPGIIIVIAWNLQILTVLSSVRVSDAIIVIDAVNITLIDD